MKRKIAICLACIVIVLLLISIHLIRKDRTKINVSNDVYEEFQSEELTEIN